MFNKMRQAVKRVINRWFKKPKIVDAIEADIILQLQQDKEEYTVWDFSAYKKYGVIREIVYGDLKCYQIDNLDTPYVYHGVIYAWNNGGYTVDTGSLYFLGRLKGNEKGKWIFEEEEDDDDEKYYNSYGDEYNF